MTNEENNFLEKYQSPSEPEDSRRDDTHAVEALPEEAEEQSEEPGVSIAQARTLVEEAKMNYDDAYAEAYINAHETAKALWRISTKISTNDRKQFALTDPKVKKAKEWLVQAKGLLAELEAAEGVDVSLPASEKAVASMDHVILSDYQDSAMSVFSAVQEQVDVIASNIQIKTQALDDHAGEMNEEFWREFWSNFLEDVTIYKSDLTQYIEQLRRIERDLPSDDKNAISEVKGVKKYAETMMWDCKNLIDLARSRLRGY